MTAATVERDDQDSSLDGDEEIAVDVLAGGHIVLRVLNSDGGAPTDLKLSIDPPAAPISDPTDTPTPTATATATPTATTTATATPTPTVTPTGHGYVHADQHAHAHRHGQTSKRHFGQGRRWLRSTTPPTAPTGRTTTTG